MASLYKYKLHEAQYRVVQQRIQLAMPCSCFSTMYCVMKPPPSFSGGFHVNMTESW